MVPAALEGQVIDPIRLGPGTVQPIMSERAEARLGIGGPLDGKVVRSASTRLDYRKPVITVRSGTDYDDGVTVDADPLMTYLPKTIQVLGVRQYRIWVEDTWWSDVQIPTPQTPNPLEVFEAEVLLRLIDATPEDCRACRALP